MKTLYIFLFFVCNIMLFQKDNFSDAWINIFPCEYSKYVKVMVGGGQCSSIIEVW